MQNNESPALDIDDLVRCYYAAVVRLCQSILDGGSADGCVVDEAEDAAQETFITAARALGDYRGSASPKTWLFSIAINACRMRLRRRKTRSALWQTLVTVQRVFGRAEAPEQAAERSDRDRRLWAAVDGLDEKHRLAVILRYVHELSAGEIAQVLGITEGTVHSRLHYARQELAGRLRRSNGAEEWETL